MYYAFACCAAGSRQSADGEGSEGGSGSDEDAQSSEGSQSGSDSTSDTGKQQAPSKGAAAEGRQQPVQAETAGSSSTWLAGLAVPLSSLAAAGTAGMTTELSVELELATPEVLAHFLGRALPTAVVEAAAAELPGQKAALEARLWSAAAWRQHLQRVAQEEAEAEADAAGEVLLPVGHQTTPHRLN